MENMCENMSTKEEEMRKEGEIETAAEFEEHIFLSIELFSRKLGICILDLPHQTLKIMSQDVDFTHSVDSQNTSFEKEGASDGYEYELNSLVETFVREYTPSVVFVSSKIEVFTYGMLKNLAAHLKFRLEMRAQENFRKEVFTSSWSIFQYETPIIFIDGFTLLDELSNNKSSVATLMALSCLIKSIESNTIAENERDCTIKFFDQIFKVEQIVLEDRMFIDEDSLSALQIFDSSEVNGHDRLLKNGCFSIFQLLNLTTSDASKKLLMSWLRAPLHNRDKILQRYGVIKVLNMEKNAILFDDLVQTLKDLPNIFKLVIDLGKGKTSLVIWRNFIKFLEKTLEIISIVCSLNDETQNVILFTKIEQTKRNIILQILQRIYSIIDLEASTLLGTVVIHDSVSDILDQKREKYSQLDEILNLVALESQQRLFSKIKLTQNLKIKEDIKRNSLLNALYVPQLGYLLSADLSLECYIRSANVDWEELFRTETTIYFKNDDTRAMDEQYGDLYGAIRDIEIEILHNLQSELVDHKGILLTCGGLFSELDVLTAFAKVSQIYNYTEPEIVDDDCQLFVQKGRHPLYESLVETYIPNNIHLEGGRFETENWIASNRRIAIITGANASGKSVFLTQNGLIVFLAHIGCFVPAERARIGLVDKILTRIRTRETVLKTQSTFQVDSHQISKCISLATERSLVLIDEFGKGTDVVDGPALFGALMVEMSKRPNCPRIIACTHFRELFDPSVLSSNIKGIYFYKTEVIFEEPASQDPCDSKSPNISFLYKITEGIAERSFGIYCAQLCGLRKEIVERAEKIARIMSEGKDVMEECTTLIPEDIERLNKHQEIVKSFISWDLTIEENDSYPTFYLRKKLEQILNPL